MASFFVSSLCVDGFGTTGASGYVSFYQVGTTTPVSVYSDDACTTPVTQPVRLDANGKSATALYLKAAARCIIQDYAGATLKDIERIDGTQAQMVALVSPTYWPTTTNVKDALDSIANKLGGTDGKTQATGSLPAGFGSLADRLLHGFVDAIEDAGAVGDGTADDTAALANAIGIVAAQGRAGIVMIPAGTYLINSPLVLSATGVTLRGAGRGLTIIKNNATTTNGITVSTGAVDSKVTIEGLSVTATTTSSAAGIGLTSGNRVKLTDVGVALHRTGINASAVTDARLHECYVESTDDNAAAVGISLGLRGRMSSSNIISGTVNGSGVVASGIDSFLTTCYVEKFVTGVTLSGVRSSAQATAVSGATTGFSLTGVSAQATHGCSATTATDGFILSGNQTGANGCYTDTATTGFTLSGKNACAVNCNATTAVTTGTGYLVSGVGANATGSNVFKYATGFSLTGIPSTTARCYADTSTTGFSLAAVGALATDCFSTTNTTGFSLASSTTSVVDSTAVSCTTGINVSGAYDACVVRGNVSNTSTTDILINASATNTEEYDNLYVVLTDTTNYQNTFLRNRNAQIQVLTKVTSASASPTFTPVQTGVNVFESTYAAGASTPTIASPGSGKLVGQELYIVLQKSGANGMNPGFNAIYSHFVGNLSTGNASYLKFVWTATSKWALANSGQVTSGAVW